MIEVKNLSVSYNEKKVLNGINMTFEAGEIHAIFGLNGTGKTTFFNSIFGLCPAKGVVLYNGKKVTKKDIGFLETETFFYSYILGGEYLDIFQNSEEYEVFNIEKLATQLNIPMNTFVDNYSTGMKKKIALLGIIKLNRNVFILDEPFNGLDVESVFLLKSILNQLKSKGKTIFISSHIMESIIDICDNFYVLEDGNLIKFSGKTDFENYCNSVYRRINLNVLDAVL